MSKKKKKHEPKAEEVPKPFYFLDRAKWVWTGYEWIIEDLGSWWFGNLTNRYYQFMHEIFDEFGGCNGWSTISHAEQMIFRCAKYPVFTVDPDPMFIRRWIDVWIELQYCRIWQHVFNTLRLKKGVDEVEAKQRADTLASRFEALYHPTSPRLPQVMKPRRGSKRTKMSENAEAERPSEPTSVRIDAADLDKGLELHGPHPSPMLSYERCYRVLDRGDPEPAKYGPSSRAGFYDGARVVALVAGNDMDELKIAAAAAFHELKRIRVYERMKNAAEVVIPEVFVSEVEISTAEVVSQSGSMYTIQCITKPTLAEAAQLLGIDEAELDSQFGVCLIDPKAGQYTVMVVGNPETTGGEGPSSNPQIGIFGPPEAGVDTAGDDKV